MKNLVICIVMCALIVAPALWGQEQPRKQQEADRQAGQSYTGCLTEQQGSFLLKTADGGNVTVTGSADLSKHKNHTVKLTGRMSEDGGKKMLNVTKIEHVSASCSN
jgi:hypothetical protein